jgi:hypothetical protein
LATGGGRISLPLAIGVDRGHPQAAGSGSQPPPVAGSIYLFFIFFSLLVHRRDNLVPRKQQEAIYKTKTGKHSNLLLETFITQRVHQILRKISDRDFIPIIATLFLLFNFLVMADKRKF